MDAGQLYYVARQLKGHVEAALGAEPGQADAVPPIHRLVLGFVLETPGSSVGEIARSVGVAQSAVSAAVVALRGQGLVETAADPTDRRVSRVSPTPRLARWAASRLSTDAGAVMAPLLEGRRAEERRCVARALEILLDALRQREGGAEARVVR